MAKVWQHNFRLPPLCAQSERFYLGPGEAGNYTGECPAVSGTLRIDFPNGTYPPEPYWAEIFTPDQGTVYFPVDIPLDLDIDGPVFLQIFRGPEPVTQGQTPRPLPEGEVVATFFPEPLPRRCYGALHSVMAAESDTVPIPPMCQAVTFSNHACTGQWIDASGAVLSSVIHDHNPRPRQAVAVTLLQNPSEVIFHYTT